MTSDRDENPYQPPQSTEVVPTTMPGPAAMLLVTVASVGAWVFAFYVTCYGFLGTVRAVGDMGLMTTALAAAGVIFPIPAAFFASRFVRRTLIAKLTRNDEGRSP